MLKARKETTVDGRVFVDPSDVLFMPGTTVDGFIQTENFHEPFFSCNNQALMFPHEGAFHPSLLFHWACESRYAHEPN